MFNQPKSIFQRQNSPDKIKLLAAQRQFYTQAKRLHYWRVAGSIGLAAISPLIYYLLPSSKTILAIIGGVWLIVSRIVLEGIETKKVKQAATIQEQFDVELFGLPWNQVLAGNRVTPELINAAAASFKGDRNELKNWYADTSNLPYPLDVLLCQRANLVWDWRLRRHYAWIVSISTIFLFSLGVALAIITDLSLLDYLLALLIPSLSALLNSAEIARAHFDIADEKERIEKKVLAIWESALNNPSFVTREQCRDIQDCIYILRSKKPLVPDWWYKRLRDRYQIDMQSVVEELKRAAEQRLKDNS